MTLPPLQFPLYGFPDELGALVGSDQGVNALQRLLRKSDDGCLNLHWRPAHKIISLKAISLIDTVSDIAYNCNIRSRETDMRITTETAIGHVLFNTAAEAETFIAEMAEFADAGETFEVRPFQGNRYHVARFYNGTFEAYC